MGSLKDSLPDSLEHMLTFLHLAFQMAATQLEAILAFEKAWIERLGDLVRFRIEIETEPEHRETLTEAARGWYNKAAHKSPRIGRIQHRLAGLAEGNPLQQVFYYTRAITTIQPCRSARQSLLALFKRLLANNNAIIFPCEPVEIEYLKSHALLFQQDASKGNQHIETFLYLLANKHSTNGGHFG
jgi:hypothetical protein